MIGREEKKVSLMKRNGKTGGKGWKERGKRSDGRRRREGSGKRFEGGKKLWLEYDVGGEEGVLFLLLLFGGRSDDGAHCVAGVEEGGEDAEAD